jgi:predicted protein tyrosine phosphatase
MKPSIDPKAKPKPGGVPSNQQISSSSSNRNLPELKNSLAKGVPSGAQAPKGRLTHGQTNPPALTDSRLQKQSIISTKDNSKIVPPRLANRGSVNQDINLLPLVHQQKSTHVLPDPPRNINQQRTSIASSGVKSPLNAHQKPSHSSVSQSGIKPSITTVKHNLGGDHHPENRSPSFIERQPSTQRLSVNQQASKPPTKPISASKSFLDKDSSSLTQNSQNELKKDSINFAVEEKIKLTQRSHELRLADKSSQQLKNSFLVDRGDNDETSKMSVEVLQSIKVILDDLKRSVNEEPDSASEEEEREILFLEDKVNRLRGKLITQGFRYLSRWMERKARGKKRELFRVIRLPVSGFGRGYIDAK